MDVQANLIRRDGECAGVRGQSHHDLARHRVRRPPVRFLPVGPVKGGTRRSTTMLRSGSATPSNDGNPTLKAEGFLYCPSVFNRLLDE